MDIVIGLVGIVVGLAITMAGLQYFYLLLPIWGFIAGFITGAAGVTALFGDGFLATGLGLIVGLVVGVLFALISYLYWYFTVVIVAAYAGGILGASLFASIGIDSSWVLFIIAIGFGMLFALAVLIFDYPIYLVIVNTAMAGSAIVIGGVLLVFDKFDRDDIGTGALWERINDHWYLWLIWVAGAAIGIGAQLAMRAATQLPEGRWTRMAPAR
jgi:hypothetical protein